MRRLRLALLILASLTITLVIGSVAQGQSYLPYSSVNGSEQVIYEDNSKYDTAIADATAAWDELDCRWGDPACDGVEFVEQTGSSGTTTLIYEDYSDCSTVVAARYRTGPTPDRIALNQCHLDQDDAFDQQATVAHETGHALALSHSPNKAPYTETSIEVPCAQCTDHNVPRPYDDYNYYYKWINP